MTERPDRRDAEFLAALEDGSLAAAAFDHAAHVRAGYLYLRRDGFAGGIAAFRHSLRRFAARHGAADKYHETITVAFLALIHQRMAAALPAEDWPAFAARNPELFEPGLLQRYYRPETLASAQARAVFVLESRA